MYDSINAALIPSNATLMAGYINGKYQSYYPMSTRFPQATILSITIEAYSSPGNFVAADILDIESGDATPSEAPAWVTAMRALNRIPTLYCSRLGTWPATQSAITAAKISPPDYWVADYTGQPHLVPGSIATQYTDAGDYDMSETNGVWPATIILPTPTPAPYPVGDLMLSNVAVKLDKNGNGFLPTSIPYSTFQAATIQSSDPSPTADNAYWPGYCQVQNRNNNVLVCVIGGIPNTTRDVFVLTSKWQSFRP
jgi:hypothetical protein